MGSLRPNKYLSCQLGSLRKNPKILILQVILRSYPKENSQCLFFAGAKNWDFISSFPSDYVKWCFLIIDTEQTEDALFGCSEELPSPKFHSSSSRASPKAQTIGNGPNSRNLLLDLPTAAQRRVEMADYFEDRPSSSSSIHCYNSTFHFKMDDVETDAKMILCDPQSFLTYPDR